MYCRNCGKQVSEGAKFCENCGASLLDSCKNNTPMQGNSTCNNNAQNNNSFDAESSGIVVVGALFPVIGRKTSSSIFGIERGADWCIYMYRTRHVEFFLIICLRFWAILNKEKR